MNILFLRQLAVRWTLFALGLAMTGAVQAALPSSAILNITAGNALPTTACSTGSCFSMEISPGFYVYTNISGFDGLIVDGASVQTATGSHTGAPNGTESPGIDNPWIFFSNTGMHYTASAVTPTATGANTYNLSFSGWRVTWNGIPAINMGAGAWGANPSGVALLTCGVDCSDGDTYSLLYTATVPPGDPSGFGGVPYGLTLRGTISVPPAMQVSAGALADGDFGGTAPTYRIPDVTAAGIPDDTSYSHIGGVYDFSVTGLGAGASVDIVIQLGTTIPSGAVYRKYTAAAGWFDFVVDANNELRSAASVAGACPPPSDVAYTAGLTAGNDCVQLTIQDGGSNDADGLANGTVVDPGGLGTAVAAFVDTRTSGSSGCTLSSRHAPIGTAGDWLLIAAALAGLGLYRRRAL